MHLVMLVVDGSVVAKGGCAVGHMVILGGNLDMVAVSTMVVHWLMVHWARKFVAIDGRTDALQAWRSKFILADLIRGLAWGLLIPVTAT